MPKVRKNDNKVQFFEIRIPLRYGPTINRIYHVVENEKRIAIGPFTGLDNNLRDRIKDLICKMATVENYKSDIIKYRLQGYTYGEIRPLPHRFFFFQKCGNNFIFFGYVLKKKNSLKDIFYKNLNKEKEKYEKEFEKFIARNRKNI
jgi:hypothetical protein